jgi:hypothetical protein
VVGFVSQVHHRSDVLASALATAVVYERDGRAFEGAADTAAVGAELRNGLVVPAG